MRLWLWHGNTAPTLSPHNIHGSVLNYIAIQKPTRMWWCHKTPQCYILWLSSHAAVQAPWHRDDTSPYAAIGVELGSQNKQNNSQAIYLHELTPDCHANDWLNGPYLCGSLNQTYPFNWVRPSGLRTFTSGDRRVTWCCDDAWLSCFMRYERNYAFSQRG